MSNTVKVFYYDKRYERVNERYNVHIVFDIVNDFDIVLNSLVTIQVTKLINLSRQTISKIVETTCNP